MSGWWPPRLHTPARGLAQRGSWAGLEARSDVRS